MDFQARMIFLTALIGKAERKLKKTPFFTTLFEEAGNEIVSPTTTIALDNFEDYFVDAGIARKGETLKIMGQDGMRRDIVTPDDVGGTYEYTAEDLLRIEAGQTQFVNGKQVDAQKNFDMTTTDKGGAAIDNKKETLCAEVFMKGKYVGADGVLEIGQKTDLTKSIAYGSVLETLEEMQLEFETDKTIVPNVVVGGTIFAEIKRELRAMNTNISGATFDFKGFSAIKNGNVTYIQMPKFKGSDGQLFDTSLYVGFYDPQILAMGFASIMYGDQNSSKPKLATGKLLAYDEPVTSRGTGGITCASSPLPYIALKNRFERYKITLTGTKPVTRMAAAPQVEAEALSLENENVKEMIEKGVELGIKEAGLKEKEDGLNTKEAELIEKEKQLKAKEKELKAGK